MVDKSDCIIKTVLHVIKINLTAHKTARFILCDFQKSSLFPNQFFKAQPQFRQSSCTRCCLLRAGL
jgi:hypothetical protein